MHPMAGIREHLLSRGCDPTQVHVIIDDDANVATFLLWNLSGQLVGYQRYDPSGEKVHSHGKVQDDVGMRYYTYMGDENPDAKKGRKRLGLWGLETLHAGQRMLFLVEGVFDAIRLHNLGLPAVAMLTNDPRPLANFIRTLSRRTVAVLDRDDSGSRLARFADVAHVVPAPFKDLGEMSDAGVRAWLCSLGLMD